MAPPRTRARRGHRSPLLALAFLLALAGLAALGRLPFYILWIYAGMSTLTLAVYALDKRAARQRQWRTPEKTLHLLALAGGWPGALCAQEWLRHKSAKAAFRGIFWLTVVLNVAALAFLLLPRGQAGLAQLESVLR